MLYLGEALAEMVQNTCTIFTKDKIKISLFLIECQEFILKHFRTIPTKKSKKCLFYQFPQRIDANTFCSDSCVCVGGGGGGASRLIPFCSIKDINQPLCALAQKSSAFLVC